MLVNIIVSLWVIFIALVSAVSIVRLFDNGFTYPFQNYDVIDIPYVVLDIQGLSLNMLVDTGCGISIISNSILNKLIYKDTSRTISIEALTPDSVDSGVVKIPFTVNGNEIEEDFVVYYENDIANFNMRYGIPLHGILGNEFLNKVKCNIDYSSHSITFK